MDEEPRHRLAGAIRARRQELRLSEAEAARRAGVARNTWASAENGTRRLAQRHYAGIEQALRWLPRSVERVLAGDDPYVRLPRKGDEPEPAPVSERAPAIDLEYEIDRVARLNIPARAKMAIANRLLELYEQAEAEASERSATITSQTAQ